ncbi:MAG: methyltransferase domain-containing protein, partial [Chromatiaceae bacterium]
MKTQEQVVAFPDSPMDTAGFDRVGLALNYLVGDGLEIGGLQRPLAVGKSAKVKYVDRMPVSELRRHYPELASIDLVEVDIIDDGERLETIADFSQDFVIANHFIEHCQDPILFIKNMLRVLRNGGIIYLAIPDKRYTFDRNRPDTPVEHMVRDYSEGPEWSRKQHFLEWARCVNNISDETGIDD